jgi:hypothetical protein
MTDYKMIGNDLYDFRSQKLATVKGADIYNTRSQKVATIRDYEVYDDRYRKICSVRGDDVFDEHFVRVTSMSEIRRLISGASSGVIPVALWWFFIRKP